MDPVTKIQPELVQSVLLWMVPITSKQINAYTAGDTWPLTKQSYRVLISNFRLQNMYNLASRSQYVSVEKNARTYWQTVHVEPRQLLSQSQNCKNSRTLEVSVPSKHSAPTHGKTGRLHCIAPQASTQQAADEYRTAGLTRSRELSTVRSALWPNPRTNEINTGGTAVQ